MAKPTRRRRTALITLVVAGLAPLASAAPTLADQPLALAPVTDREEAFVPASKQEMVALLSVPEQVPQATRRVVPEYPALARQSRLQGVVYARVLVDTSGNVAQVGQVRGHAVFQEAVREAAAQWRFHPARQGQLPVPTWVTVPFSFVM